MKTLIVFGSLLGKTKRTASLIAHTLKASNIDVMLKDVRNTSITDLIKYDLIILGCSTWDDGMLQVDFRDFYKEFIKETFSDKKFAVFALGSEKYPHPFASANILKEAVLNSKGDLIIEEARFELDHDDLETKCDEQIIEWAEKIISLIK